MHLDTRILRSLLTPATPGAPLHPGPVFAAAFHLPGDPAEAPYTYARYDQPTWSHLEATLSLIEAADTPTRVHTTCFGSGMAAVHAALAITLRPGDAIVLPAGGYFTTRVLAETFFNPNRIELREAPLSGPLTQTLLEGARLLWLETPSNPTLHVADLRALVAQAHAAGVLVACDNTTATPLGQPTIPLGVDLSVVSDTKLMTGHGDLLLGHVSTTDPTLHQALLNWRNLAGTGPGPMEAWLAHRSLATLPLRLGRSNSTALALAHFLASRPEVTDVRYPGLPSHESHAVAAGQMQHGFGPVLAFTLPSAEAADRVLAASHLLTNATSFGSLTTTAERRARWGHDTIPPGLIRLSAGCEDPADLLADLDQALRASTTP